MIHFASPQHGELKPDQWTARDVAEALWEECAGTDAELRSDLLAVTTESKLGQRFSRLLAKESVLAVLLLLDRGWIKPLVTGKSVFNGSGGNRPRITLSGADEGTNLSELARVNAEIGLLYQADPDSAGKYPEQAWIGRAARELPFTSLHICGGQALRNLVLGELDWMLGRVQRVQLNGVISDRAARAISNMLPGHEVITQHYVRNVSLLEVPQLNHSIILDESGGMGRARTDWTPPPTTKRVGSAGGLGSSNLGTELPKIMQCAGDRPWWIDMEGSLRVPNGKSPDGSFSLDRARETVSVFESIAAPLPFALAG